MIRHVGLVLSQENSYLSKHCRHIAVEFFLQIAYTTPLNAVKIKLLIHDYSARSNSNLFLLHLIFSSFFF